MLPSGNGLVLPTHPCKVRDRLSAVCFRSGSAGSGTSRPSDAVTTALWDLFVACHHPPRAPPPRSSPAAVRDLASVASMAIEPRAGIDPSAERVPRPGLCRRSIPPDGRKAAVEAVVHGQPVVRRDLPAPNDADSDHLGVPHLPAERRRRTTATDTRVKVDTRDQTHGDYLWNEATQTLWVASAAPPGPSRQRCDQGLQATTTTRAGDRIRQPRLLRSPRTSPTPRRSGGVSPAAPYSVTIDRDRAGGCGPCGRCAPRCDTASLTTAAPPGAFPHRSRRRRPTRSGTARYR